MELVCPAGSLPALKVAVDQGANAVYLGFRNSTNARQFAGLNFSEKKAAEGINYAIAEAAKFIVPLIPTHNRLGGKNGQGLSIRLLILALMHLFWQI